MPVAVPTRRAKLAPEMPRRSAMLFRAFRWYARRYLARHFDAVRVSKAGPPPALPEGPALVVLNHPSWWDPLAIGALSDCFPTRAPYGPIDAAALGRYGILGRVGLFGIEPGTLRGAAQFLRISRTILDWPDAMLWVTAQGRFADVRERPVRLQPGVGHLAAALDCGTVLTLALEYPFWNERTPEALARFGEPFDVAAGPEWGPRVWTERIAARLEQTQAALAEEACRRDPALFDVLIQGRTGVGGVYDGWRRLRAWRIGRRFRPEHGRPPGENG